MAESNESQPLLQDEMVTDMLEGLRRNWEEEGNVMPLWFAYQVARSSGYELNNLPGWIKSALERHCDQAATVIWNSFTRHRDNDRLQKDFLSAFGLMKKGRGRGTHLEKHIIDTRNLMLARLVDKYREQGVSYNDALEDVANHYNEAYCKGREIIKPSTVRDAHKKFGKKSNR